MRQRRIITIISMLVLSLQMMSAQSFRQAVQTVQKSFHPQTVQGLSQARSAILSGDYDKAVILYKSIIEASLVEKDAVQGIDATVIGEYAYALALNGIFEGAVMEVDRFLLMGGTDFFAREILQLMGRTDLASYFKDEDTPSWLSGKILNQNKNRHNEVILGKDGPQSIFERANKLASSGQTVYALVLYDELAKAFPNQMQFVLCKSVVLERAGKRDAAIRLLTTVTDGMDRSNPDKRLLMNHIESLNKEKTKTPMTSIQKQVGTLNYLAYAGGSFAKEQISVDGRLGIHTGKQYSFSVNFGVMNYQKQTSFSIGVSAYKTFGIFMAGFGISDRFADKQSLFSFSPSAGISIPDSGGSGSYDIIANYHVPFSKGSSSSFSISFGRTFYFHPQKKRP